MRGWTLSGRNVVPPLVSFRVFLMPFPHFWPLWSWKTEAGHPPYGRKSVNFRPSLVPEIFLVPHLTQSKCETVTVLIFETGGEKVWKENGGVSLAENEDKIAKTEKKLRTNKKVDTPRNERQLSYFLVYFSPKEASFSPFYSSLLFFRTKKWNVCLSQFRETRLPVFPHFRFVFTTIEFITPSPNVEGNASAELLPPVSLPNTGKTEKDHSSTNLSLSPPPNFSAK